MPVNRKSFLKHNFLNFQFCTIFLIDKPTLRLLFTLMTRLKIWPMRGSKRERKKEEETYPPINILDASATFSTHFSNYLALLKEYLFKISWGQCKKHFGLILNVKTEFLSPRIWVLRSNSSELLECMIRVARKKIEFNWMESPLSHHLSWNLNIFSNFHRLF